MEGGTEMEGGGGGGGATPPSGKRGSGTPLSEKRGKAKEDTWMEHLQGLLRFKKEFGHTFVRSSEGSLGNWVRKQVSFVQDWPVACLCFAESESCLTVRVYDAGLGSCVYFRVSGLGFQKPKKLNAFRVQARVLGFWVLKGEEETETKAVVTVETVLMVTVETVLMVAIGAGTRACLNPEPYTRNPTPV